jgi:hypothetical protein
VFASAADRVDSVGRLITRPHRGGLRGRAQIIAEFLLAVAVSSPMSYAGQVRPIRSEILSGPAADHL